MSLNQLKSFKTDAYDVDELVALSAEGKALKAEYEALGVGVPEWLSATIRLIGREVDTRQANIHEQRLRQAKARLQALKPASERRTELEAEIKALEDRVK